MRLPRYDGVRSRGLWLAGAALVLLIGVGLRVWGSAWGLPELFHPDEDKIVNRALAFGKGDLNPHYFGWPSLQMYTMFVVYGVYFVVSRLSAHIASAEDFLVAFARDPSSFYLLGRWLSGLLGGLTVWLIYAAGRRLYGPSVGLVAAALLAVNYVHVKHSHYIAPDVPLTFMVVAAFWFAIRIVEDPRPRHYVAAGLLAGLAVSVKYPGFVIAVSLLVAHLLAARERRDGVGLFAGRAWLAAVLIPIAFVLGTPFSVLDWQNFLVDLRHQQIQVSRPLPLVTRLDLLSFAIPLQVLGWGVYVCLIGGTLGALWRRARSDLLLLSFPLAFLAFLGATGGMQYRYVMPAIPFFCLIAAAFVVGVVERVGDRLHLAPQSRAAAIATATLVLALPGAAQSVALDHFLVRPDTRTLARDWIERNVPPGSVVAVEMYGPRLVPSSTTRAPQRPKATVEEWRQQQDQVHEVVVHSDLTAARHDREWQKHNALIDQAREAANAGRARYEIVRLRAIPYVWQVRLELGQVSEDDLKGHEEFMGHLEPERYFAAHNVQYVVTSESARTSRQLVRALTRGADLIYEVQRPRPASWIGDLPTYSFHNPTLRVYRLRQGIAGGQPSAPIGGAARPNGSSG